MMLIMMMAYLAPRIFVWKQFMSHMSRNRLQSNTQLGPEATVQEGEFFILEFCINMRAFEGQRKQHSAAQKFFRMERESM